jgi:hypothetical protein
MIASFAERLLEMTRKKLQGFWLSQLWQPMARVLVVGTSVGELHKMKSNRNQ